MTNIPVPARFADVRAGPSQGHAQYAWNPGAQGPHLNPNTTDWIWGTDGPIEQQSLTTGEEAPSPSWVGAKRCRSEPE
jgi:hypothetical protein